MKKQIEYKANGKSVVRQINYIPTRYILAFLITVAEVLAIIFTVVLLCIFIPYFYIAALLTEIFCVIKIASCDYPPEYKVPWMLIVLVLPVAGFLLYFLFYSRKLKKKFIKRQNELHTYSYEKNFEEEFSELKTIDPHFASQAKLLTDISNSCIFKNTDLVYYGSGKEYFENIKNDLRLAKKFIFLEYFIIEEGRFWNEILEILKDKAALGVRVRVIYDDVGCMSTLPGNYAKTLRSFGIEATAFAKLRGGADSEFNNRSHRKILVIDGKIGYTGGINIADEYIGEIERFGVWKDSGLRLEGDGVWELTRLFLGDYGINSKTLADNGDLELYPRSNIKASGFVVPFSDGPRPIYERRVGKNAIRNMISSAVNYMYISTPYLIIDNDLCSAIEAAALRGVDIRIAVPHIPDKRLIFGITKSYYKRLLDSGVKIYEYTPGFIHAKNYVADGKCAILGTINLDYRSLAHHFENAVWMYGCDVIASIKADMDEIFECSEQIKPGAVKASLLSRIIRSVVRIFAPLL